jgi:Fe-S cluster assembly protein SufD
METILKENSIKDKLIAEYESSKKSLFGVQLIRDNAIENFSRQGIPHRKSEEYKYINMELVLKGDYSFDTNTSLTSKQIDHTQFLKNAIIVVIENGIFSKDLSKISNLPKGVKISSISEATSDSIFQTHYSKYADVVNDPFAALNTALSKGGVYINVSNGVVIETPIHIIHVSSANKNLITNPRNLVVIGSASQVKIIESFETVDPKYKVFNNALTEIIVEEKAIADHYKIQNENDLGYLLSTSVITQKKESVFSTNTIILSGALVRNNLTIVLDGEFIESHLNGLYLTNGNQVVDNHTLVDHRKPNCNSNELYKGIIEDKSAATFNGKIFVRKDAQKTNAFQSNKNILLSDDGSINTKPQLEIYADDVKCSHGTSTGKLDPDKIFYLRARGLSETSAKKILMHAFASEVVDKIKIEELKEYVEGEIAKRFE